VFYLLFNSLLGFDSWRCTRERWIRNAILSFTWLTVITANGFSGSQFPRWCVPLMSHKSFPKIASTTKRTNASDTPYPISHIVLFSSSFACVINRSHRQNDFAQCNVIIAIPQYNKRTTYVYGFCTNIFRDHDKILDIFIYSICRKK